MKNWIFIIFLTALVLNLCTFYVYSREKYRNQNAVSSYELNEIKQMEQRLFNYNFENEPVSKRLERLELKVFNTIGADTYKNRITALKSALNGSNNNSSYTIIQPYYGYSNFNPYYRNHPRPIKNSNQFMRKINMIRSLKTYLNGAMTGYTLPIQNNYNNNIFSNGGSSYDYYGRGHSYYENGTNDGGISVKIFD